MCYIELQDSSISYSITQCNYCSSGAVEFIYVRLADLGLSVSSASISFRNFKAFWKERRKLGLLEIRNTEPQQDRQHNVPKSVMDVSFYC